MKSTLEAAIKFHGLDTDIRNIVYHLIRSSGKAEPKIMSVMVSLICILIFKINQNNYFFTTQNDQLNYLKRAGSQWERRVRKSLNAMCTELNAPLQGQIRCPNDREEFLNKWDELSNYQIGENDYNWIIIKFILKF